VPRIVRRGTTSRCIWITRSTRGLTFWCGVMLAPRGAGFGNASLVAVIGGDPDVTRTYHFVTVDANQRPLSFQPAPHR
jgi:hypothetical protein